VEGIVWEITEAHGDLLDWHEEYPTAYDRKDVMGETFDGGTLGAFAYISRPTGTYRPGDRSPQDLIDGTRAHGLTSSYIAFLESLNDVSTPFQPTNSDG